MGGDDVKDLKIKIFADGADLETIKLLAGNSRVSGFTTNPTLLRKAGVKDYAAFAKEAIQIVSPSPISFEVFADDLEGMERQARIIAGWGENVYVKIPITNTYGESTERVINSLTHDRIPVNVTAILTYEQVDSVVTALNHDVGSYISIFAGRVSDIGINPLETIQKSKRRLLGMPFAEIIWASPRRVMDVYEAEAIGCHIITATPDILAKLPLRGKDPTEYSLETVRMFYDDAQKAGYKL